MFGNNKSIIFITKSKIRFSTVTLGNKPKETIIGEDSWTKETLSDVLSKLKKNIGNSARILLSEELAYVVSLSLPLENALNRDEIRQKAQELIPQDLNLTSWDFKEISKDNKSKVIQVAAIVKDFAENLSKATAKSDIHIEAIEPLSVSVSRLTKNEKDPIIFIYIYESAFLILAKEETVLSTEKLDLPISKKNIDAFVAFAKGDFGVEVKRIIFCGDTKNINLKDYESENLKAQNQDINPAVNLAFKKDLKGKDEEVLNLQLAKPQEAKQETKSPQPSPNLPSQTPPTNLPDQTVSPPKKSNSKRTIIFLIILLLILGNLARMLFFQNSKTIDRPSLSSKKIITPTQKPSPTSSPSAQLNISSYTISILNGSGISGEASKAETLLKENGYNVVSTDNADSYDYKQTEIHAKKNIPDELILALDKDLKTAYDSSISGKLDGEEKTDVVIIVGKNIK